MDVERRIQRATSVEIRKKRDWNNLSGLALSSLATLSKPNRIVQPAAISCIVVDKVVRSERVLA